MDGDNTQKQTRKKSADAAVSNNTKQSQNLCKTLSIAGKTKDRAELRGNKVDVQLNKINHPS